MAISQPPANVDAYLATLSGDALDKISELRALLTRMLPDAEEVISYSMPAFRKGKIVLWYKASAKHYSLFPYGRTIEVFRKELAGYSLSKGTIRFPYNKPLPADLITRIVQYRIQEMAKEVSASRPARKRDQ
jgi:uncharacterized protein YdhG (YjbR/CyaY superfamily)